MGQALCARMFGGVLTRPTVGHPSTPTEVWADPIYRPDGGHEVLPYAIEYPREGLARVLVYDTNWPGAERFVDIDLANDTWRFSFAGDDQETDPHAWEGGHVDLDLNSVAVRIAALESRGVVVAPPGT